MAGKKHLVLCLDGTGNGTFEQTKITRRSKIARPTNVLKIARAISLKQDNSDTQDADEPEVPQIVHYDIGVGASPSYSNIGNTLLYMADRIIGGITGAGLETNVEEAVTFLTNNYDQGDEIYAFGFSRGAATVRVVCNFVSWLGGLLSKDDAYFIPYLLREYLKTEGSSSFERAMKCHPGNPKYKHPTPIKIKFIGLFDTVLAQKLTASKDVSHLVSNQVPALVENAYHALAIDEQRSDFLPDVWQHAEDGQYLQQRWFAGVHTNIGGSYPDDSLANCALDWILFNAKQHGLSHRETYVKHFRPNPLGPIYDSKNAFYQFSDSIRGRKGLRNLMESTEIGIDISVILRLVNADTKSYLSAAIKAYLQQRFSNADGLQAYLLQQTQEEATRRTIQWYPDEVENALSLGALSRFFD